MRKSDVLFLIVGTNPMPNIISMISRVKEDGSVYLIHSDECEYSFSTKEIAENLERLFKEKYSNITIKKIVVDKLKEDSMSNEIIKNRYNSLSLADKVVELNFTGGTKFMSSTIYGLFKKELLKGNENIILSYFDCEKDSFMYESYASGKVISNEEKVQDKKIFNTVGINEINISHGLKFKPKKNSVINFDIACNMFNEFEKLSIEGKYKWLKDLNEIDIAYRKEKDSLNRDCIKEFLKEYISEEDIEILDELKTKVLVKYIAGDILEEFVNKILLELKDSGEIDEYIWSFEQKGGEGIAGAEVDFVILKDLNTYLLSVTLCEEEGDCKFKLFEAKVRGEQLSGDETRIGFICLYDKDEELRELLDGDSKYSKNLVVGITSFNNIKEKIIAWVKRGEE